jgi:O-antigen ligase
MSSSRNFNLLYDAAGRQTALWGFLIAALASCFVVPVFIYQFSFGGALLVLAALAVGILCLLRLDAAIGLLFFMAPLVILKDKAFGDYKLVYAAGILALWAVKKIYYREDFSALARHPLAGFVAAFTVLAAVSAFGAEETRESFKYLLKYLGNLIFIFVLADTMRGRKDARRIMAFLLAGACLEALYGCYEFFANHREAFPLLYRSKGTFYHPNIYARYLSLMLLFVTGFFLAARDKRMKALYFLCAALIAAGGLFSFSRSAVLSYGMGLLYLVPEWFGWRWRKIVPWVFAAFFLVSHFEIAATVWKTADPRNSHLEAEFDDELRAFRERTSFDSFVYQRFFRPVSREKMWEGAAAMIAAKPWLGFGPGMIAISSVSYVDLTYWDLGFQLDQFEKEGFIFPHAIANPHNLFLHVMVEMGIGGALLMLWLYGVIFTQVRRARDAVEDPENRIFFLAGTACVINDLFMGCVEPANMFGPGSLGLVFVFFASLIFAAPRWRAECRKGLFSGWSAPVS